MFALLYLNLRTMGRLSICFFCHKRWYHYACASGYGKNSWEECCCVV